MHFHLRSPDARLNRIETLPVKDFSEFGQLRYGLAGNGLLQQAPATASWASIG